VFSAVMTAERWTTRKLGRAATGARQGWWGVPAGAEAFLDQLITWRELGFNMCATRPRDPARFSSLPGWAIATLERHARDRRRWIYSRDQLASAATHDAVWNAAQRQLTRDGWMHNYLRMLWGKKILEWSASPEEALETMTAIMNEQALDGCDPNSYSGYFWTLGRYDRPWAPERPIFGTVRYMSSDNTRRKLKMTNFMEEYGSARI
jgi:deoxyribodipyrimidine photo-lyase